MHTARSSAQAWRFSKISVDGNLSFLRNARIFLRRLPSYYRVYDDDVTQKIVFFFICPHVTMLCVYGCLFLKGWVVS